MTENIDITFPKDPLPRTFINWKSSTVKLCSRFDELSSDETDGGGEGVFAVVLDVVEVVEDADDAK